MSLQVFGLFSVMAGRTLNRPGGGEDGVDDRVLVVPGREQKNVL